MIDNGLSVNVLFQNKGNLLGSQLTLEGQPAPYHSSKIFAIWHTSFYNFLFMFVCRSLVFYFWDMRKRIFDKMNLYTSAFIVRLERWRLRIISDYSYKKTTCQHLSPFEFITSDKEQFFWEDLRLLDHPLYDAI
jgi:hypothetical protein